MMAAEAKIYVEFGSGSVSVGAFEIDDPKIWCVAIKELKEIAPVGTLLPKNIEHIGSTEIVMSFLTKSHMLNVMAALTNQDLEVVIEKWNSKRLEKEAQ